jgi:hypothetical protein
MILTKIDTSNPPKSVTPVLMRCDSCGAEYTQRYGRCKHTCKSCNLKALNKDAYKKRICPSCGGSKNPAANKCKKCWALDQIGKPNTNDPRKLTKEEVENRLDGRDIVFTDDEFISVRSNHNFKCLVCEHEWEATSQNVFKGTGCPKCANKAHTKEELTQRLVDGGFNPLEEVVKADEKIKCECLVCGHQQLTSPVLMLKKVGYGCSGCATPKGADHYAYDQNISNETREEWKQKHHDHRVTKWSKQVKELADYTCDCCGVRGGVTLHSHHLESWNSNEELRFELTNGVCLCKDCHWDFHRTYGVGNNTKVQYLKFKENYDASITR